MKARIESQMLYLDQNDVPHYKKQGSVVRNSYFWALKAIADRADFNHDWEYDESVWVALKRVLLSFSESGYLGLRETILEFAPEDGDIPPLLRAIATWAEPDPELDEATAMDQGPDNSARAKPHKPWNTLRRTELRRTELRRSPYSKQGINGDRPR